MNSKVYRLLRNNKEQGPFTPEELITQGLKPYDLIWIDGRSAAWRYPGEMNEFKNYVPSPDDYLNNLIITKQENIARVSNAVQTAVAMNDNIVQTTKQKPRYKVSAAWSKIQTITTQTYSNTIVSEPKKSSVSRISNPRNSQPLNTKPLSWEQAWQDWENEKSIVVPVKTKTVSTIAAPVKKSVSESVKTAPVLEKKFEQSLDTLTDSYIDNLLLQKKRAKRFSFGKSSEFILPSLALIIIFSVGYWLLHDTKASALNGAAVSQQQTATVKPNEQPAANLNTTAANNNSDISQNTQSKKINTNISDEAVEKNAAKEKSNQYSNTKFVASTKPNNATNNTSNNITQKNTTADIDLKKNDKTTKQFDPSVINNIPRDNSYNDPSSANNGDLNAAENRPVRRRTNGADISNNQPVNKTAPDNSIPKISKTLSATDYVSVPEYVQMNDGNGSLKIQNTSDDNLDLVVIDVQYYDASGRYRKGETMNLHNLKAGKSVTIKMPRDINSSYATSKLSLVSSEADNVYAVGDN